MAQVLVYRCVQFDDIGEYPLDLTGRDYRLVGVFMTSFILFLPRKPEAHKVYIDSSCKYQGCLYKAVSLIMLPSSPTSTHTFHMQLTLKHGTPVAVGSRVVLCSHLCCMATGIFGCSVLPHLISVCCLLHMY